MEPEKSVVISFRCPKEIADNFDALVARHGLNRQDVLRSLVRDYSEENAETQKEQYNLAHELGAQMARMQRLMTELQRYREGKAK